MKVRKRMTVKKRRKNEGEKNKTKNEVQSRTRCHEGARKVNHVTEITDFTII